MMITGARAQKPVTPRLSNLDFFFQAPIPELSFEGFPNFLRPVGPASGHANAHANFCRIDPAA